MRAVESPSASIDSPLAGSVALVVVLAGAAGRLADVRRALGRNLFDLPSYDGMSLLADWHRRLCTLMSGRPSPVPVRLAIDHDAPEPNAFAAPGAEGYERVRDLSSNRGSAGVLRDLTRELGDDDHVLVVQASDLSWRWTQAEGRSLLDSRADVVLSADRDLRPAGMMRVRCGMLKRIPSIGFIDLKEQFLPRCAGVANIEIVRSERLRFGSLHTLRAYLESVADPDVQSSDDAPRVASAIPWHAGRACVEPGADVEPNAVLFDSVVLKGARVGRNALVVRSLIGSGVTVADGAEVVDRMLVRDASGRRSLDVVW